MADLRWNSVNANFNDVNSAMGNSLSGLSQAGTIFGDLRKSILDEEQKAIDNAYKEKEFEENVRQFGLYYDMAEDRLGMDKTIHDQNQQFKKDYAEIVTEVSGTQEALKKQITQGRAELEAAKASESLTPEQIDAREKQLTQMETILRTELSATALKTRTHQLLGERGWGDRDIVTPFDDEAKNESNRAVVTASEQAKAEAAAAERRAGYSKELKASYNKGSTLITKTIKDADHRQVFGRAYEFGIDLTEGTNVTPEEVANLLVQNGLRENSIFDGQSPTSDLKAFVSHPENPENPIHKLLMHRAGKASSNTGSSGTGDKPGDTGDTGDKLDDKVDLTSLTPLALDYREKQILQNLPKVEDVTIDTPEVQALMEQLYRARYSNMPKKEIPAWELKSLEQEALIKIRIKRQQEIAQKTSAITEEKNNRRIEEALSSAYDDWGDMP